MPVGQGARNNIHLGGLGRPNLFDTNLKATSIDEDIFTDQEVISSAEDGDLVLVLDVSETPDQIKYMTKSNFIGEGLVAITNNTNNYVTTATGSALNGEANLTFDGTILTVESGEVNIDISSGDPHLSFQIGNSDTWTIGVDDSDSDKFKINSAGSLVDASDLILDSSGNLVIKGALTVGDSVSAINSSGVIQVAGQTNITSVGTLTGLTLDGNKAVTPGDGAMLHLDTSTITDSNTSGSGTAAKYTHVTFEGPTLAATNSSVTTTDAATLYVSAAPSAGTNQTLTNAYALWVDAGNTRLDGDLTVGGGDIVLGTTSIFSGGDTASLNNIDAIDATTEATIEAAIDTLAALTSFGAAGATTNIVAGDVTMYNAVNDGNPSIRVGSEASESLGITATYTGSAQTLASVTFDTATGLGGADSGKYIFNVDGSAIFDIDDSGINLASGKTFRINGTTIDGDITGITAGDGLTGGGTDGAVTVAVGAGTLLDVQSDQVDVDLSEASAAVMAAADEFIFLDNDDSSAAKRESFEDLLDTVAGTVATTGLDRSGATLVVSDLHPVGVSGANNQLLTDDGDGTVTSEAQLTFTGDVLAVTGTGSATSNLDILTLTNDGNASSMTGTETSVLFNQFYYDGSSPAVADAGRISVGTEGNWTSTTSTQDSFMALETALNGTVTENVRITSAGLVGINNDDPGSLLDVRGDAGAPGILTLSTAETTVVDGDKLGRIDFQAPKETGTDAIVVSAAIWAESDVTFDASNNATDLVFATGHSEVAAEKIRFTSQNEIGIAGANFGTDGQVLTSGGAGAAVAWEDAASGAVTALNNKAADRLVTIGSTTTQLDGEATLSFASDVLTATSSSADLPMIELTNTHAGATAGKIRFNKDSGSGDDNDVMGTIEWYGTDAGEATHELLAYMDSYIIDSAAGSEAAGIRFYVAENDATKTLGLQILGQPDDDGEIDVILGAGAASTTTVAGNAYVTTALELGHASDTTIARSGSGAITVEGTQVLLAGAQTGVTTILNTGVKVGRDAHNLIDFTTDDAVTFRVANVDEITLAANEFSPTTSDGIALGTGSKMWSDLFLASAGVINFNNGNATITHSAGLLTLNVDLAVSGGDIIYGNGQNATLDVADVSGTDTAGKNLTVLGGAGTGTGAGGSIIFQTADGGGGSGSSVNSHATALTIADDLNATFADNVLLGSDSAVLSLGADADATLTHDGTTGLTIAANPFEVDSGGNIILDSHTGIWIFQDANTEMLRITESGSGDITIKLETNAKDLIFTDNGDAETFRILDAQVGVKVAGYTEIDSTPADESVSGIVAQFTAGEALVRGECVYLKASDTKMHKAVALAGSTTPPCIALAAEDLSADATGNFLLQGFITDNGSFPTYTVGDEVYTPEAETGGENVPEPAAPDSDGDLVQVLGIATGANTLFFNPSLDVIEHA